MEKLIQNDIKDLAIKNGTWFSSINNIKPILVVLAISLVLAGMAIVNHCYINC